jgi:hypothetical protein
MKLKQLVVFIDILGYGEITKKIKNDKEAEEFISFMKANEKILTEQSSDSVKSDYSKDPTFNLYEYYDIEVAFISDSLVINYKPKEFDENKISKDLSIMHSANSFIIILMRLQSFIFSCLKYDEKLLLRGGISDKYCKIKNNFAVGEGVIEAYSLESKVAKYPRIAISDSIINDTKFIEKENYIAKNIYQIDSFISIDNTDNVSYLDYLKYQIGTTKHPGMNFSGINLIQNIFFKTHKDVIEEKIINIQNLINKSIKGSNEEKAFNKVKEKFEWLKEYHNTSLKNFNDKFLIT